MPLFTAIMSDLRPKRWRQERLYALLRMAQTYRTQHGVSCSHEELAKQSMHPDVESLIARHGLAKGLEADVLAKFGVEIETETQLDTECAYGVVAHVWWDARMFTCKTRGCEWALRKIEHAGALRKVMTVLEPECDQGAVTAPV
jgi:hypothetical protein